MSLKPKHIDFEPSWSRIRSTVEKVIILEPVPRSEWSERFPDLYSLCIAFPGNHIYYNRIHHFKFIIIIITEPLGNRVYQETKNFLDAHVKNLFQVSQNELNHNSDLFITFMNYIYELYL